MPASFAHCLRGHPVALCGTHQSCRHRPELVGRMFRTRAFARRLVTGRTTPQSLQQKCAPGLDSPEFLPSTSCPWRREREAALPRALATPHVDGWRTGRCYRARKALSRADGLLPHRHRETNEARPQSPIRHPGVLCSPCSIGEPLGYCSPRRPADQTTAEDVN
jgi:hypothetical protein